MKKKFSYLLFGIALIIGGTIEVYYVISSSRNANSNQHIINSAVNDIKLPSQFKLVSSKYTDEHCLDVCANTLLTYMSVDDSPLNKAQVISELEHLGYKYDSNYFYVKTYNDKKVHVTINTISSVKMSLDVSL